MSPSRSYDGPAVDGGYQHISEAPHYQDDSDDVVYATEPEPAGEETTENVPMPDGGGRGPDAKVDADGQTTLEDWGGRA